MAQPDLHPFRVEEILAIDRRPRPGAELRDIQMVTQVLEAMVAQSAAGPGPSFHDRVAAAIAAELGQRPQRRMAVSVTLAASQRLLSNVREWSRGFGPSAGAPLLRAHALGIALMIAISTTALAAFGTGTLRLPGGGQERVEAVPSTLSSAPASGTPAPTPSHSPSPLRSNELVAPPPPTKSPTPRSASPTHRPRTTPTDRPAATEATRETDAPQDADTPEPSDTPEDTSGPEVTERTDETDSPETSGSTGGSDEPSGSEAPAGASGSETDGVDETATPES